MNRPKTSPYGSWRSPITSDLITRGAIGLSQPTFDGGNIYWVEMRPQEGGRNVIVRCDPDGGLVDVNPQPFNARTRVHEYGGGDYAVQNGVVYFSNFSDQRLYVQRGQAAPEPITLPAEMRYADAVIDPARARLICVREDHSNRGEAVNTIAGLSLEPNESCGEVLLSGNDFYASPRISPDGKRLAWITWHHPNMPWDGTELWLGDFAPDGSIVNKQLVAGSKTESIVQPEWSPSGELFFVSDRNGWWNLYSLQSEDSNVRVVCEMEAEFAMPQWIFGMSGYSFVSPGLIVASFIQRGRSQLATIEVGTGKLNPIKSPYTDVSYVRAAAGRVVFRGGSPAEAPAIIELDLETENFRVVRRSNNLEIDARFFSMPEAIEFPTAGGKTAHGFFYAPRNPEFSAPEGELPPLLVKSHGGPTSAASTAQSLSIQYWTSRGIAVLDVNYGGSTGYGREYRDRLRGAWGIVDVDDCVNGAVYLVRRGAVDPKRLMITGGSAGGYTTLCALTFRDTFKAGASHYGVSDAEALAKDTHKFESRYLDGLFGPYPEQRQIYVDRSPINFTSQLACPVIFFQGLEDRVVPPNQAEVMVEALRSKGIPVAYVAFPGEQHGFRQAKHIKRALDGELYFYSRVFGFELAEEVEPVEIENLGR